MFKTKKCFIELENKTFESKSTEIQILCNRAKKIYVLKGFHVNVLETEKSGSPKNIPVKTIFSHTHVCLSAKNILLI